MIETLLRVSTGLGALTFVVATIAIALASYFVTRAIFSLRHDKGDTDLASSIVVRISALHALILALVFAQEIVNVRDISTAASREAVLVGDTFYDLRRYDDEGTRDIRTHMAEYTRAVLYEEWPSLARDKVLSQEAWAAWEAAYGGILSLTPDDERQRVLKNLMVTQIRELSGLRRQRENAELAGVHTLFLLAAIAGIVLTSAAFFTQPPNPQNIFLIASFSAYTGLVIFFIFAFADPYSPPAPVKPIGFERIYAGEIRALAPPPD
uniref:bestrophin-like domain n=1 Tax=Roseovarius indicus TaxID=540747 RepID=UPI003B5215D2